MTDGYRITSQALQDIQNIGRYTQKQWGREQRDKYLSDLKKRFEWLVEASCITSSNFLKKI